MKVSTSELGIGNASPFSTAVSYTSTSHHVAHIMLLIPLVPNTVHDTIVGCADFFMGWLRRKQEDTSCGQNLEGLEHLQCFFILLSGFCILTTKL